MYFLLGIEILIENLKNDLYEHTTKILSLAYQEAYFNINAFDKWFETDNEYISSKEFSKQIRTSLCQWRQELQSNIVNDFINSSENSDTYSDNDTMNGVSDSDNNNLDLNHKHDANGIKYNADLFSSNLDYTNYINNTDDYMDYDVNLDDDDHPPHYLSLNDNDKQVQNELLDAISSSDYTEIPFKFKDKTFALENVGGCSLVV